MTNYERKAMDPSVRIQECIAEAPVMLLDISTLHEYSNHPFIVRDDAALDTLTRDIEANGLITPILVRRIVYNNDYEILSGHRRVAAFRLLGREEIAARVIDVDDPIAAHIVIYSNMLQRSKILPSEKGRALALRNEYLKSDIRYKTNKDWSSEWTQELMSQEFNESKSSIFRYIRLNYLIPEITRLVDNDQLALMTAVELSYFTEEQQEMIYKYFLQHRQAALKMGMIKKMREYGDKLTWNKMKEIAAELDKPRIPSADDVIKPYRKYFGSRLEMLEKIAELLEEYTDSLEEITD